MAGAQKKARHEGRVIVFVDESGLSERPTVVRTWAPVGRTPQLEFSFRWGQLSAIAGVTRKQFYFRLHRGTIRGPQAVGFLRHLRRQIRAPLLVIWDGLAVHRSRLVRQWVERRAGAVAPSAAASAARRWSARSGTKPSWRLNISLLTYARLNR